MKGRGWVVVAAVLGAAVLSSAPPARAQGIPEIAAPWLDDIAAARWTVHGPVIFVNPQRCKEVGRDVCAFVLEHELAHIRLGHSSSFYTGYVNGRALAEAEADCWAAKNAFLTQVKAAVAAFEQPPMSTTDDGQHGTGLARAKRIRACRGI